MELLRERVERLEAELAKLDQGAEAILDTGGADDETFDVLRFTPRRDELILSIKQAKIDLLRSEIAELQASRETDKTKQPELQDRINMAAAEARIAAEVHADKKEAWDRLEMEEYFLENRLQLTFESIAAKRRELLSIIREVIGKAPAESKSENLLIRN